MPYGPRTVHLLKTKSLKSIKSVIRVVISVTAANNHGGYFGLRNYFI